MKKIYFNNELVPLIKKREKTTTWRYTGNAPLRKSNTINISVGDKVHFYSNDGVKFGEAFILQVYHRTFEQLKPVDW